MVETDGTYCNVHTAPGNSNAISTIFICGGTYYCEDGDQILSSCPLRLLRTTTVGSPATVLQMATVSV